MNADSIRQLYEYTFALNDRVWACIDRLSDDQFVQELDYSLGSIRNQVVHWLNVDERWFARLRNAPLPAIIDGQDFPTKATVKTRWDAVRQDLQSYLASLDDATLAKPIVYDTRRRGQMTSDAWQILIHVMNHATDHRAQILAGLHGLGAPTLEQDLMLYLWEQE